MQDTKAQESRYRSSGVPGAAPLVPITDEPTTVAGRAGRAFVRWLKTASITLGVMYVLAWGTVTLTVVGLNAKFTRPPAFDGVISRGIRAEVARPYALPADPSVTPAEAGRAYVAMLPPEKSTEAFPRRALDDRPPVPWRENMLMSPDLFPTLRGSQWRGPSSTGILEAAAKGLSAQELAVLRTIADAPVWEDFDIVARAPAIDLTGARFQLPFPASARAYQLPLPRFASTREMAYAGVSRAAYHVAMGRYAEAESVLRGIISYGFVLKDNATVMIEELIGDIVVGTGRAALTSFYSLTNDSRAVALKEALDRAPPDGATGTAQAWAFAAADNGANRARLIDIVRSPDLSHGLRFEALYSLANTSCSSVREFVAGPGPDVREAFNVARRTLARFPSEVALIDLIERTVPAGMPEFVAEGATAGEQRVIDATRIGEKVFFNPRMSSCLIRGLGGGF